MEFILKALSYAAVFYAGRYSYLYWKNQYLEEKRGQLIAFRDELVNMANSLEETDAAIRKKWQRMVTDISKYDMARRSDSGKWTEADDIYFNSWNSAEK